MFYREVRLPRSKRSRNSLEKLFLESKVSNKTGHFANKILRNPQANLRDSSTMLSASARFLCTINRLDPLTVFSRNKAWPASCPAT